MEFSPTKLQLATMIGSIAGHLTSALADIQRLPDLLTRSRSNKDVRILSLFKGQTLKPDITFNIAAFTANILNL